MAFEAELDGFSMIIDADRSVGAQEKYCGVSAALAPVVKIKTEILVNDHKIES